MRDKEKREVKLADNSFSRSLAHFHELIPSAAALQVVKDLRQPRDNAERTLCMVPATDDLASISFIDGDTSTQRARSAQVGS